MDILESPYYRINKYLLTCLGQWPYQKALHKLIIRTAFASVIISMAIPETLRLIEVWGQLDYVIECVSILGVQLSNCIKLSNYVFNADKIEKLMSRIQNHWKAAIFKPQIKILEKYAMEGKKLTKIYSVYMYSTLGTYIIMPVMPKFLDVVMPLNESRPAVYPIPVKYGSINAEKYYVPMMFHANTSAVLVITAIVAMDTTYTVYVQHACGIFAALGDRLQNLVESNDREILDEVSKREAENRTYRSIIECVEMHKEAIELTTIMPLNINVNVLCVCVFHNAASSFANAIESSHVIVFFCVICLSVFCMSVAGYQMVMNLDKPNEAVRFAVFTLAQVTHIFFISWPGQKLIDHSERIFQCAYGARWYQASPRSQKLLMLIMTRSVEPCKLTAGKLYVMSLANFSMVMRTSMSYFTMLTSFR